MKLFALITLALSLVSVNAADERLQVISSVFAKSYGDFFEGIVNTATGQIAMRFSGKEFLFDDGRKKSFDELLDQPDIEDMFCQSYPLANPTDRLPQNFDPGRIRVEALFKTLYGSNEGEVSRNCAIVDFCGHKVRFNTRCGAANALSSVGKDLEQLFKTKPELKIYTNELGGTFTWRLIAGTTRLSNHSFGNAIDLNVGKSNYWRWDSPARLAAFSRKNWPTEIIEAFERHGIIWGGKWWHYDTMHFEFRPDLIAFSRKFPETPKPWPLDLQNGDVGTKLKIQPVERFERPDRTRAQEKLEK